MEERQSKTFVFLLVEFSFMINTKVTNMINVLYRSWISRIINKLHKNVSLKNNMIDIKDNYTSFS